MATARENVPSQRVVDACYMGGAFWVVTHGRSAKVREMKANPCVSLCSSFHTFKCKAHFMGHPLLPANQAAREALAGAFEPWHFACNDEGDSNLCYLRIVPESGFSTRTGQATGWISSTGRRRNSPLQLRSKWLYSRAQIFRYSEKGGSTQGSRPYITSIKASDDKPAVGRPIPAP